MEIPDARYAEIARSMIVGWFAAKAIVDECVGGLVELLPPLTQP